METEPLRPPEASADALVVHEITIEDLIFNLSKKTTQKSKRGVGIEALQSAIDALSAREDGEIGVEESTVKFGKGGRVAPDEGEWDNWEPKVMDRTPKRQKTPQKPQDSQKKPQEHTETAKKPQETKDQPALIPILQPDDNYQTVTLEVSQTYSQSVQSKSRGVSPSPTAKMVQMSHISVAPTLSKPPPLNIINTSRLQIEPKTPEPIPQELTRIPTIDIPPSDSNPPLIEIERLGTVEVQPIETVTNTVDEETATEMVGEEEKGVQGETSRLEITNLEGISAGWEVRTPKFEPQQAPIVEEREITSAEMPQNTEESKGNSRESLFRIQPVQISNSPRRKFSSETSDTMRSEVESAYATVVPIVEEPLRESIPQKKFARRHLRPHIEPSPPLESRNLSSMMSYSPPRRKLKPVMMFVNPILRHLEGSPQKMFPSPMEKVKKNFMVKRKLQEMEEGERPGSLPPIFTTEVSRVYTGMQTTSTSRKALSLSIVRYTAAHINYEASLLEKPFSPFRCTKIVPCADTESLAFQSTQRSAGIKGNGFPNGSSFRADETHRSESESPGSRRGPPLSKFSGLRLI